MDPAALESIACRLESSAKRISPAAGNDVTKRATPDRGSELAAWEAVTSRLERIASRFGGDPAARLESIAARLETIVGSAGISGTKSPPARGNELEAWAALASRLESASGGALEPLVVPKLGNKWAKLRAAFFYILPPQRRKEP